jgi:serine/threonine protein kinase
MISAASPGQVIDGRYTIIKLVGRGAMADVFEARDGATSEKVAIKILRDVVSQNPDAVARFEREAQVQQRIRHPNVAVMYGAGMHGSSPYLALELLGGRSLLNVLRHEKRIPLMRAVAYGWQALQGLAATHAAGVLHRDLKPANLMLRPNGDGTERVVLIDFGFASLDGAAGITRQGFVVGSLTYMAPERLRSEPIDVRADLYGLAVVLYELLGGVAPFRADDDATLIGEILEAAPLPLTELVEDLPPEVDKVITRALSKYPHERAASATDMAAELAAAVGVG